MNKEEYINEAREKMEKINSKGTEIHTLVNNVICGEWDCDLQCQLIKDEFRDEEAINKEANYQADRITLWATTDPVYKHYKREEITHKGDKESKGGEKMKQKKTFIIETPDKKIKITRKLKFLGNGKTFYKYMKEPKTTNIYHIGVEVAIENQ